MQSDYSNQPRVVPAAETDLPAISRLAAVIWRACYPGIISMEQIEFMLGRMYSIATMQDELQTQGIHYDRLLIGDSFVGFAAYGPTENPAEYKLHKLYLEPARQGRGLGSLLLQHCERAAGELGARRLILAVNKRNDKAIAAYRRNGFQVVDSVVVPIGGGFVMDDYLMAKLLA